MNTDASINALRARTKYKITTLRINMKEHIFKSLKEQFTEEQLQMPMLSVWNALSGQEKVKQTRNIKSEQGMILDNKTTDDKVEAEENVKVDSLKLKLKLPETKTKRTPKIKNIEEQPICNNKIEKLEDVEMKENIIEEKDSNKKPEISNNRKVILRSRNTIKNSTDSQLENKVEFSFLSKSNIDINEPKINSKSKVNRRTLVKKTKITNQKPLPTKPEENESKANIVENSFSHDCSTHISLNHINETVIEETNDDLPLNSDNLDVLHLNLDSQNMKNTVPFNQQSVEKMQLSKLIKADIITPDSISNKIAISDKPATNQNKSRVNKEKTQALLKSSKTEAEEYMPNIFKENYENKAQSIEQKESGLLNFESSGLDFLPKRLPGLRRYAKDSDSSVIFDNLKSKKTRGGFEVIVPVRSKGNKRALKRQ
jgi:hypothetical protein